MKVPFVNLKEQFARLQQEITIALEEVFHDGQFIGGKQVNDFETAFGSLISSPYCIATGNCTDALFAALKVLGAGQGHEIIVPAFGWISCAAMTSFTGALPVFADVDNAFYTIDPADVARKITPQTRGIVAVHLYGQAAPVNELKALCREKNLFLIEDCAQAQLTEDQGKTAGTVGDFGCFSFYPTKNLGAYGDAGCAVTSNREQAVYFRRLVNHGGLHKDEHLFEGINSRMDTVQAALLNVKLKHLEEWTARRIALASVYRKNLEGVSGIKLPQTRPDSRHTFHLFVVRTQRREDLIRFLLEHDIEVAIHYPRALPFEPAYEDRHFEKSDFPVAASLQDEVLSLPLYPELTEEKVEHTCNIIRSFFAQE